MLLNLEFRLFITPSFILKNTFANGLQSSTRGLFNKRQKLFILRRLEFKCSFQKISLVSVELRISNKRLPIY